MHHFLIVEHDQAADNRHSARKMRVSEADARAIPAFEAISMGLMPSECSLAWHDARGQSILRMTYHSLGSYRLLAGDPRGCDTHDPLDLTHIQECKHATNSYRYTWYEAPDDKEVRCAFIERLRSHDGQERTFSHGVKLQPDNTLWLPKDVQFSAQEVPSRASFRTTWWTPS